MMSSRNVFRQEDVTRILTQDDGQAVGSQLKRENPEVSNATTVTDIHVSRERLFRQSLPHRRSCGSSILMAGHRPNCQMCHRSEIGDRRELVQRHSPPVTASARPDCLGGAICWPLVGGPEDPARNRSEPGEEPTRLCGTIGDAEHPHLSPDRHDTNGPSDIRAGVGPARPDSEWTVSVVR